MPQGIDGEGHFPQHPFGVWVKMMPLFLRDVREAVPYMCPLSGLCVGGDALHRPALFYLHPHWSALASPLGRGGSGVSR